MTRTPLRRRLQAGFTLTEMLLVMSLLTIVGGAVYALIQGWNNLYVRNFALNDTAINIRKAVDRISQEMESAAGPPTLLDHLGAAVPTNNAVQSGTAVGTVGLGARFNRQNSSGTASTLAFWVKQTDASNGKSDLRFYPNGFSATSTNFVVLASNILAPTDMSQTNNANGKFDYPFQYFRFNNTQRCLGVNLRARAAQVDRYIATSGVRADPTAFEEFNTFFQLRTVVSFRSPVLVNTVITNNNGTAGP